MSVKIKMISGLIGLTLIQAGSGWAAEEAAQIATIMATATLTAAEKATQVTVVLSESTDLSDREILDAVVNIVQANPQGAAEVLAGMIAQLDTPIAQKVVAAASLAASHSFGFNTTALATALNAEKISVEKMDALIAATQDPAAYLSATLGAGEGVDASAGMPSNEIIGYGLQTKTK